MPSTITIVYHVMAIAAYLCIAAVLVLAIVFGRRARRHVKKEKVTKLPNGLSPLDIQRIFIGKTYPRRITKALLTWWATRGYITIEQVSRCKVRVTKIKEPPYHNRDEAVFFDRGTYVRERDLFQLLIEKSKKGDINILSPIFTRDEVERVNDSYAVREDDGVYSPIHYKLKVLTLVLSLLPLVLATVWCCIYMKDAGAVAFLAMAMIGYFVLMFVRGMPILFKLIWCAMWLGASLGGLIGVYHQTYDPLGIVYSSEIMMFLSSFVLIRFVDYREKINLADYSDLINYRKYLLFAPAAELTKEDYYAVLPYLYAFGIKQLVRRKFGERDLPDWYKIENGEAKGALL